MQSLYRGATRAHLGSSSNNTTRAAAATQHPRHLPAAFSSCRLRTPSPASRQHNMLSPGSGASSSSSGGGNSWWGSQPRRALSVSALFNGFKWPFGGSAAAADGKPRRRGGCELGPREPAEPGLKFATFGGGCFWGLELAYQRVPGVVKTTVGYTGGQMAHPTYDEVCMGVTGHAEVVQVTYDPQQVSYRQLLDVFFNRVDPTTLNRQGNDRGTQYRSGIYTHDLQQQADAQEKIAEVNKQLQEGAGKWLGRKVVTEVEPCGDYYLAEKYHQQYLERGGRFGAPQSAAKGCKDTIRCYG